MANTHKLIGDSKIIYPFGPQCKGYSNDEQFQSTEKLDGTKAKEQISYELTQDVIDLMKGRDEDEFNALFVSSKKADKGNAPA